MNSSKEENGYAPRRVILYARVSTDEQAKRGYSIPDQLRELRREAKHRNYHIIEEIIDDGYSGATLERPGLERVIELAEAGACDVVLAAKRDRYFRSRLKRLLMDEDFKEYGVSLAALNDTGNRIGDGVQDDFAEWEREQLTERTKRGKLGRARAGKVIPSGSPPLGFTYDGETLKVDEAKMSTVRRIFRDIGERGMGLHEVKRSLERDSVSTANGAAFWHTNALKRIVFHDAYKPHTLEELAGMISEDVASRLDPEKSYGVLWYNRYTSTTTAKGTRLKGSMNSREDWIAVPVEDAGVPREVVDAARERVEDKRRPSRADNRFWSLSGHAYCPCGRLLACRSAMPRGERYHYYVCSRYDKEGSRGCEHGKRHRAEELEGRIFWAICEIVRDPESLRKMIGRYIEEEIAALKAPGKALENAYAVLKDVQAQRARYQEMASRDLITLEELADRLKALDERKAAAEEESAMRRDAHERLKLLEAMREDAFSLGAIAYVRSQKDDDELLRDLHEDLKLKAVVHNDGTVDLEGVFGCLQLTTSTRAGATATGWGGPGSGSTRARPPATPP